MCHSNDIVCFHALPLKQYNFILHFKMGMPSPQQWTLPFSGWFFRCLPTSSTCVWIISGFSVACQPPAPISGKKVSDFRCQPTKSSAFLCTYIIYRLIHKNNAYFLQKHTHKDINGLPHICIIMQEICRLLKTLQAHYPRK